MENLYEEKPDEKDLKFFVEKCREILDDIEKNKKLSEKFLCGLFIVTYKNLYVEGVPIGYAAHILAMCLEFFYQANILPKEIILKWKEDIFNYFEESVELH
ncbi:MAG TPA: hypothetical protein ENG63_07000 [Candidatus Desulfofervidus auxilii]|uniref:Uncharacterized protein n=1 Tax=Desulfofervidus auxilii TaxID=1621989 RepID=A0A7C0Y5V4_DESA2|nr:hypothetical protein [Candidatus Desulfofervidus auxilii]